ncbi:phospholipase A2 [Xylariomycetidae sp. FL2044]|nr:phospholipase A2 [Xylariomycetidae sp. FL2044]
MEKEEEEEIPDPIRELLQTYNELNPARVPELDSEPSPLEFMRHVARNAPFVVRGGARDWPAVRTWDAAYLRDAMAGQHVNVAVTPRGNADAPTWWTGTAVAAGGHDEGGNGGDGGRQNVEEGEGEVLFAKPHEEDQDFAEFLAYVINQEKRGREADGEEVRYAQTQNDNLRHEYQALFNSTTSTTSTPSSQQLPPSIPFARVALQRDPDAVNLWIGNSRSVTALHRDGYENIYVQVRGRKHFVLLPPVCQPCVGERALRGATYVREREEEEKDDGNDDGGGERQGGGSGGDSGGGAKLRLELDEDGGRVPFPTWDPDSDSDLGPEAAKAAYSDLANPLRVTLDPGDMLYLPAMWYHKVSQSCSKEGICVAVNYWYDMDFSGPLYPLTTFVRSVYQSRTATPTAKGAMGGPR